MDLHSCSSFTFAKINTIWHWRSHTRTLYIVLAAPFQQPQQKKIRFYFFCSFVVVVFFCICICCCVRCFAIRCVASVEFGLWLWQKVSNTIETMDRRMERKAAAHSFFFCDYFLSHTARTLAQSCHPCYTVEKFCVCLNIYQQIVRLCYICWMIILSFSHNRVRSVHLWLPLWTSSKFLCELARLSVYDCMRF